MDRQRARRRAIALTGGALFALLASFGHQAERLMQSDPLAASDVPYALLTAAILLMPATLILAALLWSGERRADERRRARCAPGTGAHSSEGCLSGNASHGVGRLFKRLRAAGECEFSTRKAFCLILLCYVPMFVIAFPGSFAYDVPFQLKQVFTGEYSSHHPLLHTLVLGACIALGKWIGHVNLGAALYTAVQATALAGCFALTCTSLARQSGERAARRAAVFFALYPLHMIFAVNATKDVLFGGLFALTLALAREIAVLGKVDKPGASASPACRAKTDLDAKSGTREATSAAQSGWKESGIPGVRFAALFVCASLMLLLRNNAVYAVAVWIAFLLHFSLRRGSQTRMIAALAALSVVAALAANGVLSLATGAAKGDLCEMLSWPIQQLARARLTQGEKLTQEEKTVVDMLMPAEAWRLYNPAISDPVKFEFDTRALLDDPARCVSAYLSIARKCPQAYFDALLLQTYSFLYPYSAYRVPGYYAQMNVGEDYYDGWWEGERIHSAFPGLLSALAWRVGAQGAMQFPMVGWLLNMGVIVWTMLFFVLREAYAGRWTSFSVALLCVLLWGTYLLGPVMAGRYVYPFACALPVLSSRIRLR